MDGQKVGSARASLSLANHLLAAYASVICNSGECLVRTCWLVYFVLSWVVSSQNKIRILVSVKHLAKQNWLR